MGRTAGILCALCLFLCCAAPGWADSGGRYALVIGNSAYGDKPLKNPANDARDVAKSLARLGFDVQLKTDVPLRDMEEAIRDFGLKLRRGGVGLFYYAGHGVQVQGVNYLVPVGARLSSESDVKYECVDAGRVLGKMEDAGNGLNLVILDACRNNPFARGFRSAEQGLARMDAPTGSLVAYATAPNSVASDGSGQNGLYTKHLLANIETPGIAIEEVFKRVRIGVMGETAKKQVPWESSSLSGYLYLAGGQPSGQAATAAAQVAAAREAERRRQQDEKLRQYLAGLEAEKKLVERERAELARQRQQVDADAARRLKEAQAPQEQRLREQLAILEAERRKLEQERAELARQKAEAEAAQKQALAAAKAAAAGAPQVASVDPASVAPTPKVQQAEPPAQATASRPSPPAPAAPPPVKPPREDERAAILQRLAGLWRLETEAGLPLPLLGLRPGGDTLLGTLEGDPRLLERVRLTGLAMDGGNLHVRLSVSPPPLPRVLLRDPEGFLRNVLRARQAERVLECVGNLRATLDGDIPMSCRRVDADAGPAPQDISGRMVRAAQDRDW